MRAERGDYLQARDYERTAERKGHVNSCKLKTAKTRVGEITPGSYKHNRNSDTRMVIFGADSDKGFYVTPLPFYFRLGGD